MKRLTTDQKELIQSLRHTLSVRDIAKKINASRQTVNYYFKSRGWERIQDIHFLTNEEKEFISNNVKVLTVPQIAVKLFGESNDVTRSRIYGYLDTQNLKHLNITERQRQPVNVRPEVINMIRVAAERFKKNRVMYRGIELTIQQAECIKHWRCVLGYSWRGIARITHENFEELRSVVDNGNQISGIELCDSAMLLLGEKVEDGWN